MATKRESDRALETYRHLRMLLVTLALFLLIASLVGWQLTGEIEASISANYLGPLRNVFVASLVGIGVLLIAYRGRPLEDYALNLAGFYAVFVAFVPTQLRTLLADAKDDDARADIVTGIQLSMIAVLAAAAVFLLAELKTRQLSSFKIMNTKPMPAKIAYWLMAALSVGFVVLVVVRTAQARGADGDDLFKYVHLAATFLMMSSMVIAVSCYAWPNLAGEADLKGRPGYGLIVLAMAVGGIGFAVASVPGPDHLVAVAEWWEIFLFGAFWFFETVRNWNGPGGGGDPADQHVAGAAVAS